MSDEDLPARLAKYDGHHVELKRIATTREQVAGLISFPASEKYLKLAAVYREMAFAAMPSAPDPEALELTLRERNALADKLRRMTVENGCTEAEADTALQMLLRLENPLPEATLP
jgi:hypothetical protein